MKGKNHMLIVEAPPLLRVMKMAAGCAHAGLRASADGYILKNVRHEELRVAMCSVRSEKPYPSRCFLTQMIARYLIAVRELFFRVMAQCHRDDHDGCYLTVNYS